MTVLGFTRPAGKLAASIEEAESLGFTVLAAPSLEIIHGDASEFQRLKASLGPGIPVIFGSTTAADHCSKEFGYDFPTLFTDCTVIAIGPGTKDALESYGVRVDRMPQDYSSYGVVNEIVSRYETGKVVAVRSDSGTDIISKVISSKGLEFIDIAAYKLIAADVGEDLYRMLDSIKDRRMDWMAFTSPMSALSFFQRMEERFGEGYLDMMKGNVKVAAIGRPTADMLRSLGREPDLIPEKTTFHDLLAAIKERC